MIVGPDGLSEGERSALTRGQLSLLSCMSICFLSKDLSAEDWRKSIHLLVEKGDLPVWVRDIIADKKNWSMEERLISEIVIDYVQSHDCAPRPTSFHKPRYKQ